MILISQIDLGIRARSSLSGIPELAEDISSKGLISPILVTHKTPSLVSSYETFHQIRLDPTRPLLLTCGGRRLSALMQLGVTVLYPGVSSNPDRPGYIARDDTGLLDLLLIEGRENRNRQDLDWRDDMKLIVSAYRLAKQTANAEGEYLVMKDFANLLGVSHTHLGIAERIYDDYFTSPDSYKEATSVYDALTISLKKVATTVTKVLLHRQLNEKPVVREVKSDTFQTNQVPGPDLPPIESVPQVEPPSAGPITIYLSQAFFRTDYIQFLSEQPKGFCDHVVTEVGQRNIPSCFTKLVWNALPKHGYVALFTSAYLFNIWKDEFEKEGFLTQFHPLIWNKIDYRYPVYRHDQEEFPQSYDTCLLARKPGSQMSVAQNASIYTCSHKAKESTFGPDYIPPEVFSWILRGISLPGQVIYDPFARTGASAISILSMKCRPIGTESNEKNYGQLITNLKDYYTKHIPSVQFI